MKRMITDLFIYLLALTFLFPVIITFVNSFMTSSEIDQIYRSNLLRIIPMRVTFDNFYELFFATPQYLAMFWNSLFYATVISLGNIVVSFILGFTLSKIRFVGASFLRLVFVITMLMPYQVTLLPNYIIIKGLGLYNTIWGVVLPGIFAPFGVFLMCQFLHTMPDEIVEAASLETNSAIKTLFYIIAPVVYPGALATFLLSFSNAWNMVEQPLILLNDNWLYPLSLALNDIYSVSYSIAFAGGLLYLLPIFLLYWLFEDELVQGISTISTNR